MFEPREKTRKKHVGQVNELITPDAAHDAVYGAGKFAMTPGAWAVLGVFGVIFFAAMAAGYLVTPGALFVVLFLQRVKPQRVLAVTPHRLIVVGRSALTGRPNTHVTSAPLGDITIGVKSVIVAGTELQLKKGEVDRLRASVASAGATRTPAQPTHPFVVPQL